MPVSLHGSGIWEKLKKECSEESKSEKKKRETYKPWHKWDVVAKASLGLATIAHAMSVNVRPPSSSHKSLAGFAYVPFAALAGCCLVTSYKRERYFASNARKNLLHEVETAVRVAQAHEKLGLLSDQVRGTLVQKIEDALAEKHSEETQLVCWAELEMEEQVGNITIAEIEEHLLKAVIADASNVCGTKGTGWQKKLERHTAQDFKRVGLVGVLGAMTLCAQQRCCYPLVRTLLTTGVALGPAVYLAGPLTAQMVANDEFAVSELKSIQRQGELMSEALQHRGTAAAALRDVHELRDRLTRVLRESNKQWYANQQSLFLDLSSLVIT